MQVKNIIPLALAGVAIAQEGGQQNLTAALASQNSSLSSLTSTCPCNQTYANITGGQRVQAQTVEGNVTFYSALRENSTVTTGNVNFTAGTIHVIDKVLSVPQGIADTLRAANLTAALGAVQAANVTEALASTEDLTIFVPNNEAFRAIGNLSATLGSELPNILQYHVVAGSVLYSPDITNTSLTTLNGANITISVINETVYVNNAEVLIPTSSLRMRCYRPHFYRSIATETGANDGGGVRTTSSSTEAAPMRTAAVGAAALFGGMAAYMNM
ncbi:fasciclin domain-containing protein [Colletotrichum tofieldiae]|nr:fasciclin domain-containing protein [Colletotrichum tofieldiae]